MVFLTEIVNIKVRKPFGRFEEKGVGVIEYTSSDPLVITLSVPKTNFKIPIPIETIFLKPGLVGGITVRNAGFKNLRINYRQEVSVLMPRRPIKLMMRAILNQRPAAFVIIKDEIEKELIELFGNNSGSGDVR